MTHASDVQGEPHRFAGVLLPLTLIALAAVIQVWNAAPPEALSYELGNDSAMRLVMLRDLMDGQGWWDLHQYRLGLEGGFEMHWSRLIDAPMIAMIWAFDALGLPGGGTYWVLVLWPLLWFAVAVLCLWRIALELSGTVAAVFAALLASSILISNTIYRPGSIDHHNVQIGLLLLALLGVVLRKRSQFWPLMAGVFVAVSLGIGVETMPHLALMVASLGLIWAFGGPSEARPLAWCSASLGVTLWGVVLGFAPRSALTGGYCDAVSVDLVVPVALGAAVLWLAATFVSGASMGKRLGALIAGGALVVAGTVMWFPACLSNPLDGLDPYLHDRWLALVAEAQGLGAILDGHAPRVYLGYYLFGAASVLMALGLATRNKDQCGNWLLVTGLVFAAFMFSVYQLRGVILLAALCVVPVAVVAANLRGLAQRRQQPAYTLAAVALLASSVPGVWTFGAGLWPMSSRPDAPRVIGATPLALDHLSCVSPAAMATLADLPTGVVAANSNLGAQIMLHSPHRVLSAPYHRNQAGMRAQLEISLAEDAKAAQAQLRQLGVTYVVTCAQDPELGALRQAGFSGFGWALQTGEIPDFLEPITPTPTGGMHIFRLRD